MKLLFSGSMICTEKTFKRMLLLADEIGFMDWPSHGIEKGPREGWGTIGMQTPMRGYKVDTSPVVLSTWAPPRGPIQSIYRQYIESDLASPAFRKIVLDGLRSDDAFSWKHLSPDQVHKSGTGADIRRAMAGDPELEAAGLPRMEDVDPSYKIATGKDRIASFAAILVMVSMSITDATFVSESTGLLPVSDDATTCKLIAMRAAGEPYLAGIPAPARRLVLP